MHHIQDHLDISGVCTLEKIRRVLIRFEANKDSRMAHLHFNSIWGEWKEFLCRYKSILNCMGDLFSLHFFDIMEDVLVRYEHQLRSSMLPSATLLCQQLFMTSGHPLAIPGNDHLFLQYSPVRDLYIYDFGHLYSFYAILFRTTLFVPPTPSNIEQFVYRTMGDTLPEPPGLKRRPFLQLPPKPVAKRQRVQGCELSPGAIHQPAKFTAPCKYVCLQ